jgi:YidC/Oxa1 family membrane protein insertase
MMQGKSGRLILFLVLYTLMLGLWFSMMKPGQQQHLPPQERVATLRQQATELETKAAEREKLKTELEKTVADLDRSAEEPGKTAREKELIERERDNKRRTADGYKGEIVSYQRDAIKAYREIVNLDGKADAAIDARIQMARLHEELAHLGVRGELEQAEQQYKDLAKQFATRTARVTIDGQSQRIEVGAWAGEKVAAVQRERAEQSRHSFLYRFLDVLVRMTGRIPGFSYWFALAVLTLVIKALLYPFSKRQYQSMQDMARVAPLIKEAQEKLKGRPAEEIHRRTMAIYKEHNVSFTAGCLPAIVQMLALIPLYQMVRVYEYEFRNGTFAWIGSALSYQYPQWMARNLSEFDIPLCLLYIVSFYLTSKITPMSMTADPVQRQQQKIMAIMMPLIFGWMMFSWRFPAAFTLYWLVLNIVSTIQQYRIIKQYQPAPISPSGGPSKPGGGETSRPEGRPSSGDGGRSSGNGGGPAAGEPGDGNGRRAQAPSTPRPATRTPAAPSGRRGGARRRR